MLFWKCVCHWNLLHGVIFILYEKSELSCNSRKLQFWKTLIIVIVLKLMVKLLLQTQHTAHYNWSMRVSWSFVLLHHFLVKVQNFALLLSMNFVDHNFNLIHSLHFHIGIIWCYRIIYFINRHHNMCANKLIKFILIQIEIDNLAIFGNFKKLICFFHKLTFVRTIVSYSYAMIWTSCDFKQFYS